MSEKIRITYSDGRVETVKVRLKARVLAEQHFKGYKSDNVVQASTWIAWWLLKDEGKEDAPYEDWLGKVDDFDEIDDEDDDDLDPTNGATTTVGTSDTPKPIESSPSALPLDSPSES